MIGKKSFIYAHILLTVLLMIFGEAKGKPVHGMPKYYIIGGHESKMSSWPWQAGIVKNNVRFLCGGTLIQKDAVLTAAHCVHGISPQKLTVVLGDYDRTKIDGTEQHLNVLKISTHPRYGNDFMGGYDLSVLHLESEINRTFSVLPVPKLASQEQKFYRREFSCFVTGWGLVLEGCADVTSPNAVGDVGELAVKLQEAQLDVMRNNKCNSKRYWNGLVKDTNICAFYKDVGACEGDSGGPLVCREDGAFILVGTTSWGSVECRNLPTVFTRIASFTDWINKTLYENSADRLSQFNIKLDINELLGKET